MNRYLMMSAAAVMASAGAASTPSSAMSWTIGTGEPCQGFFELSTGDGIVFLGEQLSGGNTTAIGIAEKNKRFNKIYAGGKKFAYFDTYGTFSLAYGFAIQLPVTSGNRWTEFATNNGTSAWEVNSGTYCIVGAHSVAAPIRKF